MTPSSPSSESSRCSTPVSVESREAKKLSEAWETTLLKVVVVGSTILAAVACFVFLPFVWAAILAPITVITSALIYNLCDDGGSWCSDCFKAGADTSSTPPIQPARVTHVHRYARTPPVGIYVPPPRVGTPPILVQGGLLSEPFEEHVAVGGGTVLAQGLPHPPHSGQTRRLAPHHQGVGLWGSGVGSEEEDEPLWGAPQGRDTGPFGLGTYRVERHVRPGGGLTSAHPIEGPRNQRGGPWGAERRSAVVTPPPAAPPLGRGGPFSGAPHGLEVHLAVGGGMTLAHNIEDL